MTCCLTGKKPEKHVKQYTDQYKRLPANIGVIQPLCQSRHRAKGQAEGQQGAGEGGRKQKKCEDRAETAKRGKRQQASKGQSDRRVSQKCKLGNKDRSRVNAAQHRAKNQPPSMQWKAAKPCGT